MPLNKFSVYGRDYCFENDLSHELTWDKSKSCFFSLNYLTTVQVLGKRAKEFLQGQLTCDVNAVTEKIYQRGALCTVKGRIVSLMTISESTNGELTLILPKDMVELTLTVLNKVAPFFQVSFKVHNDSILGVWDPEKKVSELKIDPKESIGQKRGSLAWHLLQLEEKNAEIYPETTRLFLPHRLDLHLKGFIDFNKGCYRGQEIVARTHYLGKQKYELKNFVISTQPNEIVFNQGELIDYCPISANQYLILASVLIGKEPW